MVEATDKTEMRVLIASSDTHVGPPLKQLRKYCDRAHLEEFDAFSTACPQTPRFFQPREDFNFDWEQVVTPGHYDVHERLRQLDEDGVTAEVIFHGSQNGQPIPFMPIISSFSSAPESQSHRVLELSYIGMHIYNRWLADFCSVEPNRHVGLAYLPLWDIDLAITELEWARESGLKGINFPAPRPSLPDYNDPVWEPFWSACAAHDMPLETHGGSETATHGLANYVGQGGNRLRVSETGLFSFRSLPWLILGGVFDRHPQLKLGLTEVIGVSAWLPLKLLELDELEMARGVGFDESGLQRRPSDYFKSNCFIGASFMSHADARGAIENGFVFNHLWGSDFPHLEGSYPHSKTSLQMSMGGLPEVAIRQMAGLNLVNIFGLDRDQLEGIANRIGPAIHEIRHPKTPVELPTEPPWINNSLAFRKGSLWV